MSTVVLTAGLNVNSIADKALRVGLFFWLLVNHGPAGFDLKTFQGPALTFLSFANSTVPLAVLELYLRAQTPSGAPSRLAMATVLFALTVAMGIGVVGATIGMWLPIIRTGQLFLLF